MISRKYVPRTIPIDIANNPLPLLDKVAIANPIEEKVSEINKP
jgi:hypothetical protein